MANAEQVQEAPTARPTPEEYSKLLHTLTIGSVRLVELHAKALAREVKDKETEVQPDYRVRCEFQDEEHSAFEAFSRLDLAFRERGSERELGSVTVEMAVLYRLEGSADDGFLQAFAEQNVPLNAWPFLREVAHSAMLRFGWTPLVLPPFLVMPQAPRRKRRTPRKEA